MASATTVFILMIFVSIYVFSLSTYTYISSLSNVDLLHKTRNELNWVRRKRDVLETSSKDNWTQKITFNVCCDENQWLNEKLECAEAGNRNYSNKIDKLLKTLVVEGNMAESFINSSRVDFVFDRKDFLLAEDRFVVDWSLPKPASYYISQQDGSLLKFDLTEMKVLSKFSTHSYCMDQTNTPSTRNFVGLVKPCKEKMCIQKCCSEGFYFNTLENKCVFEEDSQTEMRPKFFFKTKEIEKNISYFLIAGIPKCLGPDAQIKINENSSLMYLQEDGFLMTVAESENAYYFYEREKYCVDMFSNGTSKYSFLNGFYCPNEAIVKFDYKTNETMGPNSYDGVQEIGENIKNIGDKIGEVASKMREGAIQAEDKIGQAAVQIGQLDGKIGARSNAEIFIGSLSAALFFLVMCMF